MVSRKGHSVLVVPVPALEPFVVERTAHYDPSFLSEDPSFVHAHITLLAPWLAEPAPDDLQRVAKLAATTPPFRFELEDLHVFPGGTLHLAPEPAAPFEALTAELVAAFPQCPPYAGRFDAVPHLTLDHLGGGVTVEQTRAALGALLPAECVADRISLQWYANHGCRTVHEWELSA
jgi:2'-5' RNA ligase